MAKDTTKPIKLDDADRRILALLQTDGRATYARLAEAAGISTASAHDRVRKLEQKGVILGYQALVNPRAVGAEVTAFVAVSERGGATYMDARDRLIALRGVEECHSVAGDESFMLKVRAQSTVALERLVWNIRSIARIERTRTIIVLSTAAERRPVDPFPDPEPLPVVNAAETAAAAAAAAD
jgi:Lrp/AsnC family leucine-responsive transcriptional regulator